MHTHRKEKKQKQKPKELKEKKTRQCFTEQLRVPFILQFSKTQMLSTIYLTNHINVTSSSAVSVKGKRKERRRTQGGERTQVVSAPKRWENSKLNHSTAEKKSYPLKQYTQEKRVYITWFCFFFRLTFISTQSQESILVCIPKDMYSLQD